MMHYFDLSDWESVEQIEKRLGRDYPAGRYHGKVPSGYLEYDDTRNGCAFDHFKKRSKLFVWWKNSKGVFHTPKESFEYSYENAKMIMLCKK